MRQPFGCHRGQHPVIQDTGRVHYGGQVWAELRDHGCELVPLGDVTGHQVHLSARFLELVLQLPCTRRLFTSPTEQYKPPHSMSIDQVPGQHGSQRPRATGDEDSAPTERAVVR